MPPPPSAREKLEALLDEIKAAAKQARVLISVVKEGAAKRDHDLLGRVFDDLLDVEISIARLLK